MRNLVQLLTLLSSQGHNVLFWHKSSWFFPVSLISVYLSKTPWQTTSSGAFYLLIQVNTPIPDMTLVKQLIRNYGVAVIPGSAFGIQKGCYLRIAYGALNTTTIAQGLDRLVQGLANIVSDV
jgi:aspartate/methionine/tyrosine aminotransferase